MTRKDFNSKDSTTTAPSGQASRLDPSLRTGLILAGMGGPDSQEAVEPFLRNLFRDPAVLPMPRLIARLLGSFIVRKRVEKVKERYRQIGHGGGSPQLKQTQAQCDELARLMTQLELDVVGKPAMRYWHPFAEETVDRLREQGAKQFLLVPAYPQYAGATSGSVIEAVQSAVRSKMPGARLFIVKDWHLLSGYLDALVQRVEPVLRGWHGAGKDPETCTVLFVAHSLPERFLKDGDPYVTQTRESVKAVHHRLEDALRDIESWRRSMPCSAAPHLAFQSKVGPVKWVGPEVTFEVQRLADEGCRSLCIVPVSFTCEHIETLHELDIELAELAGEADIIDYVRVDALNLDQGWLTSLASWLAEHTFDILKDKSDRFEPGGAHE